jgi:hypothetical protein
LSDPGSRLRITSTTEASKTISFIARRVAPLGDEFVGERRTSFDMFADEGLAAFYIVF